MNAIDTNIIVRYLTKDHPEQSAQAQAVVDLQPVFVSNTVFLETEWVLRSAFGYSPAQVVRSLTGFSGLLTVNLEDAALVAKALDGLAKGLDFADALHLASVSHCDAFLTFDLKFAKVARTIKGEIAVRAPEERRA